MSEAAILWVLGAALGLLGVLVGICFRMITSHMRDCSNWQKQFLVEHGHLQATQSGILQRLERVEQRADER